MRIIELIFAFALIFAYALAFKRRGIVRLCVFFACLFGVSFLCTVPTKEEWLRWNAFRLSRIEITDEMIAEAAPWQKDTRTWIYSLSRRGVVPVGEDEAVYVVSHSWDGAIRPIEFPLRLLGLPTALLLGRRPVVEAAMAVDKQGRLYTTDGNHLGGGLWIISTKEVKTLQDFLEADAWKPYPE